MVPPRHLCAVGLIALVAAGCSARPEAGAAAVGRPFPALRLAALEGAAAADAPVTGGRNVVLNVWATWCEPCRREMASLERLARTGGEVEVVGLSVDEDINLAREFVLAEGVRFANYSDPGGRAVRDALGVQALPQTFVVRRDGTLVARIVGPRDWAGDEARSMLRETLALSGGGAR
jgi:cytochrome c biogenesis protein CcmG, thiol:disulfide interchange protein DsbE